MSPCMECGMPCTPSEYHPYAACLMFKACHNSDTVRGNLQAVLDDGALEWSRRQSAGAQACRAQDKEGNA